MASLLQKAIYRLYEPIFSVEEGFCLALPDERPFSVMNGGIPGLSPCFIDGRRGFPGRDLRPVTSVFWRLNDQF
jgi:hypothetical protein